MFVKIKNLQCLYNMFGSKKQLSFNKDTFWLDIAL